MKQIAMSMTGYFDKGKTTRRERFLAEMERVVPWARFQGLIEPSYPKGSAAGGRVPRKRSMTRSRCAASPA